MPVEHVAPRSTHRCNWPGCRVDGLHPGMWGCKNHWYLLPGKLRSKLYRLSKAWAFETLEYDAAMAKAQSFIERYLREGGRA